MGAMEGRELRAWNRRWAKADRRRNPGSAIGSPALMIVGGIGVLTLSSCVATGIQVELEMRLRGAHGELGPLVRVVSVLAWVIVPLVLLVAAWRAHGGWMRGVAKLAAESGLCADCDYDLRSSAEARPGWRRCPECGLLQPSEAATMGAAAKTRR